MADIVQLVENGEKKFLVTHPQAIEGLSSYLLDLFYPINAVYFSFDKESPEKRLGGKWEKIQGRFLIGASDSDLDFTIGKTGGEKEVTLTTSQLPAHTHDFTSNNINNFVKIEANSQNAYGRSGNTNATTAQTGGGKSHNNLPPYIAVATWRRIA